MQFILRSFRLFARSATRLKLTPQFWRAFFAANQDNPTFL